MGWDSQLKWMSGFLISKPPFSPSLGWHQDGWYWNDEVAYQSNPAQIFAMYYLTDTTIANGCLRAIPGTHRKEHALHSQLGAAHSDEVRSSTKEWQDAPEHASVEGEVNITVKAGDLVIGDARVLHGARRNKTDSRRSLITLWYIPNYHDLNDEMRSSVEMLHRHQCGTLHDGDWNQEAIDTLLEHDLLPDAAAESEDVVRASEYDHNLSMMHRTPGYLSTATPAAIRAFDIFGDDDRLTV